MPWLQRDASWCAERSPYRATFSATDRLVHAEPGGPSAFRQLSTASAHSLMRVHLVHNEGEAPKGFPRGPSQLRLAVRASVCALVSPRVACGVTRLPRLAPQAPQVRSLAKPPYAPALRSPLVHRCDAASCIRGSLAMLRSHTRLRELLAER